MLIQDEIFKNVNLKDEKIKNLSKKHVFEKVLFFDLGSNCRKEGNEKIEAPKSIKA